jgi:type I restriction enzyme S subunit
MIAARVSSQLIEPAFLQHVWNSNDVRRQIESLARTTNGTFKVNQTVLEGINFMIPPERLQQEFSRRANAVGESKKRGAESLAELEVLFRTLQHRAFSGELLR